MVIWSDRALGVSLIQLWREVRGGMLNQPRRKELPMEREKSICSVCDGSGSVVKNDDVVDCSACGGDGFIYDD
jgi:hypothetical protein